MRLRSLRSLLLSAAVLMPLAALPAEALITPTTKPAYSAAAIYQNEVLVRTNAERTKRGLRPLAKHLCPDGYSDRWAPKLGILGRLQHQALSPILSACRARLVGENLAAGEVSAAQMVSMWMNSPGHRANILNPAYTHMGVGSHKLLNGRIYGVQVFVAL